MLTYTLPPKKSSPPLSIPSQSTLRTTDLSELITALLGIQGAYLQYVSIL